MTNITKEELLAVQKTLDKFNYPVCLEIHLDKYWRFTYDSELEYGFYPTELDYIDDAPEGCRLAGDFIMVNCVTFSGNQITRIFSRDKIVDDEI